MTMQGGRTTWRHRLRSSPQHRARRAEILADSPPCVHCGSRLASVLDHQPPLALFSSYESWLAAGGIEVPSCLPCSHAQGSELGNAIRWRRLPTATRAW